MKVDRFLSSPLGSCVARMFATLLISTAFASNNPIPQVVGPPIPQSVKPGSGEFTVKVYGANFVQGAAVNWNRSPRTTTFVSARELHAQILASDVEKPTAGYITVTNPSPGGGVSSSSYTLVEVHAATSTISVGPPHVYLRDIGAQLSILSDFNNDGILDFATDYGFSELKVMLGNGDGTFGHGSIIWGYAGSGPAAIAAGDFNNDGNKDLVYGANPYFPPNYLRSALGNGDGTFRKGFRFGKLNNYAFGLATADFDQDGNLDIASITAPFDVDVFLGQGDGSFKHRAVYTQFFSSNKDILVGDFNGDGIPDLVTDMGGIYVLLGRGDGTFQKPQRVIANKLAGSCGFGPGLFVTDFNGDGKADLAYCEGDTNSGKIWIALGNGDGTFKKPTSLPIPGYQGVFEFAVGDFNSDSKTDLIANYFTSGKFDHTETDLFLGNGDGTFQPKKIISLPGEPWYNAENGFAVDDFNSDGLLDFILKEPGAFNVFVQHR